MESLSKAKRSSQRSSVERSVSNLESEKIAVQIGAERGRVPKLSEKCVRVVIGKLTPLAIRSITLNTAKAYKVWQDLEKVRDNADEKVKCQSLSTSKFLDLLSKFTEQDAEQFLKIYFAVVSYPSFSSFTVDQFILFCRQLFSKFKNPKQYKECLRLDRLSLDSLSPRQSLFTGSIRKLNDEEYSELKIWMPLLVREMVWSRSHAKLRLIDNPFTNLNDISNTKLVILRTQLRAAWGPSYRAATIEDEYGAKVVMVYSRVLPKLSLVRYNKDEAGELGDEKRKIIEQEHLSKPVMVYKRLIDALDDNSDAYYEVDDDGDACEIGLTPHPNYEIGEQCESSEVEDDSYGCEIDLTPHPNYEIREQCERYGLEYNCQEVWGVPQYHPKEPKEVIQKSRISLPHDIIQRRYDYWWRVEMVCIQRLIREFAVADDFQHYDLLKKAICFLQTHEFDTKDRTIRKCLPEFLQELSNLPANKLSEIIKLIPIEWVYVLSKIARPENEFSGVCVYLDEEIRQFEDFLTPLKESMSEVRSIMASRKDGDLDESDEFFELSDEDEGRREVLTMLQDTLCKAKEAYLHIDDRMIKINSNFKEEMLPLQQWIYLKTESLSLFLQAMQFCKVKSKGFWIKGSLRDNIMSQLRLYWKEIEQHQSRQEAAWVSK